MTTSETISIQVEVTVNANIEKVWKCFTSPEDIVNWNTASDDWHTTKAENDLQAGGKFNYRMEAKDGSFGFDFWGIYDTVTMHQELLSTLGDGRKLEVRFSDQGNTTNIVEVFDAENQNPVDLQRGGWQAILNNFKKYIESND